MLKQRAGHSLLRSRFRFHRNYHYLKSLTGLKIQYLPLPLERKLWEGGLGHLGHHYIPSTYTRPWPTAGVWGQLIERMHAVHISSLSRQETERVRER